MKCTAAIETALLVGIAVLAAALPSLAASPSHYTLYYLDQTHNVSRVTLDGSGKPVGKPERLTQDFAVDAFSVSPGGKIIIGMRKTVSTKKDALGIDHVTADVLVWNSGMHSRWPQCVDITGYQTTLWTKSGRHIVFVTHDALSGGIGYSVFRAADGHLVVSGWVDDVSPLSPDERFIVTSKSMESHFGSVMKDLRTGAEATFSQPVQCLVWIGDSGKAAWIYDQDQIQVGRPMYTSGRLELHVDRVLLPMSKNSILPDSLYYGRDKRLYITGKRDVLYVSKDLKTYAKVGVISPHKKLSAKQALSNGRKIMNVLSAEYSPDGKLIAYFVQPKEWEQEEIRIADTKSDSCLLAPGTAPHWESSANIWNPNGTDPRGK